MEEKAIVILHLVKRNLEVDLEIPLNITANDLVIALNSAYNLGINTENVMECYVKCENPIALLRGNKTLADFGVRNGSDLYITE
ncbi:MAG: hypothetical protein IJH52_05085 [Oscillospiraceae bacterium]|nr:hypothetical protein [Oscillospiraceae bacterium]MBQ6404019.1 hypothetical protein [Oscillospiraceae bacterium]